jgi:AcrR family transcriptional regulator
MPRVTATRSETTDESLESGRLTRADRRDALLDAAVELVVTGDADAVSMEAVAERAGVSRPLVYKHFANRGELLAAVYQREATLLHRELAAEVGAAATVEEMFRTLIRGALQAAAERGHVFSALRSAGGRVTSCAVSNAVAMSRPSGPSRTGDA